MEGKEHERVLDGGRLEDSVYLLLQDVPTRVNLEIIFAHYDDLY